jgi:hypothetical protein
MAFTRPASSRSYRGSHLRVAAHQRPSGRSHSTRTDRSTITSPTTTRSRTQISPGIHGANQHPQHNHSPPVLTQHPVQISDSAQPSPMSVAGRRKEQSAARPCSCCRVRRMVGRASACSSKGMVSCVPQTHPSPCIDPRTASTTGRASGRPSRATRTRSRGRACATARRSRG